MSKYFIWLIALPAVAIALIIAILSYHLYQTTLTENKTRLTDNAVGIARQLESQIKRGLPERDVLTWLRDSHKSQQFLSPGYEFVLGKREGEHINFLLEHRYAGETKGWVPYDSELAEPMRRALRGEIATVIAPDYRGETVVAAFTPVRGTAWGLVAKVDLASIRNRFLSSALFFGSLGVVIIILLAFLTNRITRPLRKRLETGTRQMEAIIKAIGTGVVIADIRGIIINVNPAIEELFGFSREELVGRNIKTLMPPATAAKHDGYLHTYLSEKGAEHGQLRTVTAQHRNGIEFKIGLFATAAYMGQNAEKLLIASIFDLSEKIASEKRRHEAEIAAETAERTAKTKAQFLANMSHEIRTPMNAIIGFTDLALKNRTLSQEVQQYISKANRSAKLLLAIINDILDFSKIESGKLEFEEVCFNLVNTLLDVLQTIESQADQKGLKLFFHFSEELPKCYRGDPTRLRQVVLNLVGNAIKFTNHGEVTISLEKEAECIHFRIIDTGIGMTADQMSNVFNSFTQADSATTRRFGGTGLGTTISKQIIEAMGGKIWIESEVNIGSTFHILLELPHSTCKHGCKLHTQIEQETAWSPRIFHILLVEDNIFNGELIELNLSKELGHTVTWVTDGKQAVDLIRTKNNNFDLILMDIQMPVMDGLTATREIRSWEAEQGSNISIIALTASALLEDRQKCKDAGMNGFVTKPIDFTTLLGEMEKIVPQGIGAANTNQIKTMKKNEVISLTPLCDVADVTLGIQCWLSPERYARALIRFTAEYSDAAERIQQFLNEGKTEQAQRLAHTLKGLTLGLTDVTLISAKLDSALKSDDSKSANESVLSLRKALNKAAEAIGQLKVPTLQDIKPEDFNNEALHDLLKELLSALSKDNPDTAEPVLNMLATYLPPEQIDPLRHDIEQFDFRTAESKTKNLLHSSGDKEDNHE